MLLSLYGPGVQAGWCDSAATVSVCSSQRLQVAHLKQPCLHSMLLLLLGVRAGGPDCLQGWAHEQREDLLCCTHKRP